MSQQNCSSSGLSRSCGINYVDQHNREVLCRCPQQAHHACEPRTNLKGSNSQARQWIYFGVSKNNCHADKKPGAILLFFLAVQTFTEPRAGAIARMFWRHGPIYVKKKFGATSHRQAREALIISYAASPLTGAPHSPTPPSNPLFLCFPRRAPLHHHHSPPNLTSSPWIHITGG